MNRKSDWIGKKIHSTFIRSLTLTIFIPIESFSSEFVKRTEKESRINNLSESPFDQGTFGRKDHL